MKIEPLFEEELSRRGLSFTIDPSGRYAIDVPGGTILAALENLLRDFDRDSDVGRISRFVESVVLTFEQPDESYSREGIFWNLERNDYIEPADFRVVVSDQIDRVLVHLSADGKLITWVSPTILELLHLSESEAAEVAFANLQTALEKATIETSDVDGVSLGMIETDIPFKSSLILSPGLKEAAKASVGWPLMAVAPDRDFLYLWASSHTDFVGRVGDVVVREYLEAPYPLSTEVFVIDDTGTSAIGAFPVPDSFE